MKNRISRLIATGIACLCGSMMATSALALETYYTATVNGYTFSYRLDGGNAVIERSGLVSEVITYFPAVSPAPSGAFEVPATLDGHPVTGLGRESLKTNALLTAVTLPESLTEIGESVFFQCTALQSVNIPDGVTGIGPYAFGGCSALTGTVTGAGVKSVGFAAFANSSGIKDIRLPAVTNLGACAFRDISLMRVTFLGNAPASVGSDLYSSSSAVTTNYVFQGSTGWSGTVGDATIPATWQGKPVVVLDSPNPFAVTTASLPDATEMVAYSASLAATNGTPPYSWSLKLGYLDARAASTFATVGTAKGWKDDDRCWETELPFAFPFYGQSYSTIHVGSNGTLSFGGEFNAYQVEMDIFTNRVPVIAALWNDLDTSGGDVYVESSPDHVTIRWEGRCVNSSTAVSFAATLSPDGKIVLSYGDGNADGGFIGVSAGDGVSYLLSSASQSGTMAQARDVVFTPRGLPAGLALSAGGVVSGTPTMAGTNFCDFTVQDAAGRTVTQAFPFIVKANANTRPVIQSVSPADSGIIVPFTTTRTFSVSASDPEGAPLSYVWMYDGAVLPGATSASYSFAPTAADRGKHTLSCTVSDGLWTIRSQVWAVSVKTVLYVDGAAGLDANSGLDSAHAKKTIQAAVDAAVDGDSVIVADGVYAPVSSATGTALTIESVNGEDFTIIDGGNTGRCFTVCNVNGTIGQDVVLRGFTLRNGNADQSLIYTSFGGGALGGTLSDCVLMNNYAGLGGGGAYESRLAGCVVRGNHTDTGLDSHGGGILNCFAERTRIEGNTSTEDAGVSGGQALSCIIWNNSAKAGGGAGNNTGLINCTIVGNAAVTNAGVGECYVHNSIIWGNTNSAGRVLNYTHAYTVVSTNGDSVTTNKLGTVPDSCCTVPVDDDSTSIADDPLFSNAAAGDFRLLRGSPCIGAASMQNLWYEDCLSHADLLLTTDFVGNPRTTDNTVTIGAYESFAMPAPAPVIVPANGTVFTTAFRKVAITNAAANARIYYTTNGADPVAGAALLYTGPFNIRQTTTIKAFATRADLFPSAIATATIVKQTVAETYGDLAASLDVPTWTFSASAIDAWTPLADSTAKAGTSSARSAVPADSETVWMQTTVRGSGTVEFWWKASCEDDPDGTTWDHLEFAADGVVKASLDGETGWVRVTVALPGTGTHILRWAYVKDESGSAGGDCGWVDGVVWTSGGSMETSTTTVSVPYVWLDSFGLAASGDYEAAATAGGANGVPVWQSYVAGLDPTDSASQFMTTITYSNNVPFIAWTPDLGSTRIYTVQGKANLTNSVWVSPTNSTHRFFRVTVEMK